MDMKIVLSFNVDYMYKLCNPIENNLQHKVRVT